MKASELNTGLSIHMRIPESQMKKAKCHIIAIVKDPDDDSSEMNQIVFRYWSPFKKRWFWKVVSYWILAMYNKWECEMLNNKEK